VGTIRTRTRVIELMKENLDNQRDHFSYYDVLVRKGTIDEVMKKDKGLRACLLRTIREFGSKEENNDFTAQELRAKLPVVVRKPKVLRRFVAGKVDLDDAYRAAKISEVEERLKQACTVLDDVSGRDVSELDVGRFNAVRQAFRKLAKQVDRVANIIKQAETDGEEKRAAG